MISASGNMLLIPSAAAWFASMEVRQPLKESMARITFMTTTDNQQLLFLFLIRQLLNREGEVGVRVGLITECKVPPLSIEWLKALGKHSPAQNHAVLELFGCDAATVGTLMIVAGIFAGFRIAAEVGMTFRTKPVESSTHVEFLFCSHIE